MSEESQQLLSLGEDIVSSLERIGGHLDRAATPILSRWFPVPLVDDALRWVHFRRGRLEARRCEPLLEEFRQHVAGEGLREPDTELNLPANLSVGDVIDVALSGDYWVWSQMERLRRQAHIGVARMRVLLNAIRGAEASLATASQLVS